MVTRKRIQGETIQILVFPEAAEISRVFANFKGPTGPVVVAAGVQTDVVIGSAWGVGVNGWMITDFGATPPFQSLWIITQDSSAFPPGQWGVEIWVVDEDDNKTVLTTVSFEVALSLANGAPSDLRSTAAKAVAAIECYLSDPKNITAGAYKINNRELTRYSISELKTLLRFWNQRLRSENIRSNGRQGVIGRRIEVTL